MIYAGLISFEPLALKKESLIKAVGSLTQNTPTILLKNSLVLCYGKISVEQDFDSAWENADSVLIGRAFEKESSCSLNQETFKNLSHLDKEVLLEKIWGKYVYFNIKEDAAKFEVVLDSTGQLPFFYYLLRNGSLLFTSDIEIIYKVLSQKPEYNWSYLCSYLLYGNSSSIETPFNNIYELPPACTLTVKKDGIKTLPFWDPLASYHTPREQGSDAVGILRKTLKPWIEPYKNICVSLSGGLDSSSLTYCLKDLLREDQNLKAVNYFHSQIQSSNELVHARKVCQDVGIKLIEVDASDTLPFDPPQRKPLIKPNKPLPGLISLRWGERIFEVVSSAGPFLYLSGHGSDHIFMCPPTRKSALDYMIENGLKGFKKELERTSHYYRDSLFSIFKENISDLIFFLLQMKKKKRSIKENLKDIPQWIKQEVIQNVQSNFSHPIYNYLSKKILPGKYEQVDTLYEGIASIHVELMNKTDPTFYPFLYQPAVEFALSFPTYKLFEEGYDRYPLRKSVSDMFKTDAPWRRDKSQTTGIFQLGVKQNLKQVLDLCLEGKFVEQRLIDKEALAKTINLIGNGDTKHLWPLIQIASAELFFRSWDE